MSRIIKFRAWGKDSLDKEPRMSNVFELNDICKECGTYDGPIGMPMYAEPIIMQYTNLKDKNGVEIYEGDVLRVYFKTFELEDWLWLALPDEAKEKGYFDLEVKMPEIYQNSLPEKIEVIGNVWEHPHLLNHDSKTTENN